MKLPSVFGIWVPDELELQLGKTKEEISQEVTSKLNSSIIPIKTYSCGSNTVATTSTWRVSIIGVAISGRSRCSWSHRLLSVTIDQYAAFAPFKQQLSPFFQSYYTSSMQQSENRHCPFTTNTGRVMRPFRNAYYAHVICHICVIL